MKRFLNDVLDFFTYNSAFLFFVVCISVAIVVLIIASNAGSKANEEQVNAATRQAELYSRTHVRLSIPSHVVCAKSGYDNICGGEYYRVCEIHSNPTPNTHHVLTLCCSQSLENNPGCIAKTSSRDN